MTPDAYFASLARRLDAAVLEACQETARWATLRLRAAIPTSWTQTRAAIVVKVERITSGFRLRTRLQFRKRFNTRGEPKSVRLFYDAWHREEPKIIAYFRETLNTRIAAL